MAKLTLYTTGKLTATADPRVKEGLLLPFGEVGRTNKGRLTASAGVLQLADELDPVTLEHDDKQPIATFEDLQETPGGLKCSIRYLPTRAGDDALAEYEAGVRTGLSVEIDDLDRSGKGPTVRAGKLVAGLVTGASQVRTPAFMSAKLAAAEDVPAPDQGTMPDYQTVYEGDNLPSITLDDQPVDSVSKVTVSDKEIAITTTGTTDTNTEGATPMTASRPKVQAPNLVPPAADDKLKASAAELFAMLAAAQSDGKMLATLSDIVPANILATTQPQWVGELWSGKAYQRKVIPLFTHADLTNLKVQGWRWTQKPAVGLYAGNKGAVPSGTIGTEPVEITAQRIAGAHDIDRAILDFGNAEFWQGYNNAMTESYAKVSDAYVLAQVVAAAPAVTPGTIPSGVAKGWVYLVDAAIEILNSTDTMPTSAIVATDLWRDMILTRKEDVLEYLTAALGLEDGSALTFKLRPSAAMSAGKLLASCPGAVTVHELGGEAPIRVDAVDMAKGGVDKGVFGYVAVNVHDADGLALVSAA